MEYLHFNFHSDLDFFPFSSVQNGNFDEPSKRDESSVTHFFDNSPTSN